MPLAHPKGVFHPLNRKGAIKMAKVKLNPVLEQFRGQIGDLVFKHCGDEVIVGRKPDRSGIQPTEAQLEHQERFRQAAKIKGKPLFSLTVADFFNAPVVVEVDHSAYGGDAIVIRAHNDFKVTRLPFADRDTKRGSLQL